MVQVKTKQNRISANILRRLASAAWAVRENAYVVGNTMVGCAVLSDDGRIFTGCNVEHRFRCHDVHAEINAITAMVAAGARVLVAVVIVAERKRFTPCGGCMDWIMQFGSSRTRIVFQSKRDGKFYKFTAADLMPHYPH